MVWFEEQFVRHVYCVYAFKVLGLPMKLVQKKKNNNLPKQQQ